MSNQKKSRVPTGITMAIIQIVIVIAFIAFQIYQIVKYEGGFVNIALLVLWFVCGGFVIVNYRRTQKALKEAEEKKAAKQAVKKPAQPDERIDIPGLEDWDISDAPAEKDNEPE